jgi:hypothetical protein
VTSLVDPTMYRPKKKMTKAERLMTALYVTHYCKIKHTLMPMLGGQADDIIRRYSTSSSDQPSDSPSIASVIASVSAMSVTSSLILLRKIGRSLISERSVTTPSQQTPSSLTPLSARSCGRC